MNAATRAEAETVAPLTDLEVAALQRRLAPANADLDLAGATTVRDVAEAADLPESDVVAHLRRIRAESAFAERPVARSSALPWIAAATLVTGLGVTWWRLHPDDPLPALRPAPPAESSPTIVTRTNRTTASLMTMVDGSTKAPAGFRVEAIGQVSDHEAQGEYGEIHAAPYEAIRDGLVASGEAVVAQTQAGEGVASIAPPGARYRGADEVEFSPRPGFVRVAIAGWAGREAAWVAVPLTDVGRAAIRALATKVLADVKRTQDEALAPVGDPQRELVSPPPGFSVRFAGRRLDVQHGPRVSFAPIPATAIAARLEAALLNAAQRDGRPPIGPWTGDAAVDARIPRPDLSRAEIMGPDGTIATADVPTQPGDAGATARAIHDLAARAARAIEATNRSALGANPQPHP